MEQEIIIGGGLALLTVIGYGIVHSHGNAMQITKVKTVLEGISVRVDRLTDNMSRIETRLDMFLHREIEALKDIADSNNHQNHNKRRDND